MAKLNRDEHINTDGFMKKKETYQRKVDHAHRAMMVALGIVTVTAPLYCVPIAVIGGIALVVIESIHYIDTRKGGVISGWLAKRNSAQTADDQPGVDNDIELTPANSKKRRKIRVKRSHHKKSMQDVCSEEPELVRTVSEPARQNADKPQLVRQASEPAKQVASIREATHSESAIPNAGADKPTVATEEECRSGRRKFGLFEKDEALYKNPRLVLLQGSAPMPNGRQERKFAAAMRSSCP